MAKLLKRIFDAFWNGMTFAFYAMVAATILFALISAIVNLIKNRAS